MHTIIPLLRFPGKDNLWCKEGFLKKLFAAQVILCGFFIKGDIKNDSGFKAWRF